CDRLEVKQVDAIKGRGRWKRERAATLEQSIAMPRLQLRNEPFEPDDARQRSHFFLLIGTKRHDERKGGGFQPLHLFTVGIEVARFVAPAMRAPRTERTQGGLNLRPVALLVRRQSEPSLEVRDLRIVEKT